MAAAVSAGGQARPGSVGEEAERLFASLQQAAAAWTRGAPAAGPTGPEEHLPQTCGVCPVCQAIARLGQARPEVVGHLAEATSALVAAFSALASDQGPRTRPGHGDPTDRADRADPGGRGGGPAPSTTEHIDVTD